MNSGTNAQDVPTSLQPRQGFVVFLDALGTSSRSDTQETVLALESAGQNAAMMVESIRCISPNVFATLREGVISIDKKGAMDYRILGDTFLIVAEGPGTKGSPLDATLLLLRNLPRFFNDCLRGGVFLRGAISYGEYWSTDPKMQVSGIFGPAVNEARAWHDRLAWIGIALTQATSLRVQAGIPGMEPIEKGGYLVEYHVPLKAPGSPTGSVRLPLLAVDWPNGAASLTLKELSKALGERPIPPEAAEKYLNTLEFYRERRPSG